MTRYSTLLGSFDEIAGNLATGWREEKNGWQDQKSEEFGREVISPIAKECVATARLLQEMDSVLSSLLEKDLIDEK